MNHMNIYKNTGENKCRSNNNQHSFTFLITSNYFSNLSLQAALEKNNELIEERKERDRLKTQYDSLLEEKKALEEKKQEDVNDGVSAA